MARKPAVKRSACSCERCQSACSNYPGEFRPGEAERVAKFLGLSMRQLFKRYLAVNWWVGSPDVFMLTPASDTIKAGCEWPGNPERGKCVFLAAGRCSIHPVKPYSCAHGNPCDHGKRQKWEDDREFNTVPLWAKKGPQGQIVKLLGRKPKAQPFSYLSAFLGGS